MSKEMREQIARVKNWKQFLNEEITTDFKKGDKVLVNPEIIKNQMESYEKMMKKNVRQTF